MEKEADGLLLGPLATRKKSREHRLTTRLSVSDGTAAIASIQENLIAFYQNTDRFFPRLAFHIDVFYLLHFLDSFL